MNCFIFDHFNRWSVLRIYYSLRQVMNNINVNLHKPNYRRFKGRFPLDLHWRNEPFDFSAKIQIDQWKSSEKITRPGVSHKAFRFLNQQPHIKDTAGSSIVTDPVLFWWSGQADVTIKIYKLFRFFSQTGACFLVCGKIMWVQSFSVYFIRAGMSFFFPALSSNIKPPTRSGHVAVHWNGFIAVWGGYHVSTRMS